MRLCFRVRIRPSVRPGKDDYDKLRDKNTRGVTGQTEMIGLGDSEQRIRLGKMKDGR